MKTKLSLSLDDLQVESFTTAAADRSTRGTVEGYIGLSDTETRVSDVGDCNSWYCGDDRDGPSHNASCGVTCQITGYNWCYDNPCRQDW